MPRVQIAVFSVLFSICAHVNGFPIQCRQPGLKAPGSPLRKELASSLTQGPAAVIHPVRLARTRGGCRPLSMSLPDRTGDISLDVLKTEAVSLGIPDQKQSDYVYMQMKLIKDAEIALKDTEKEKELALKDAEIALKDAEKEKEKELALKDLEKEKETELALKELALKDLEKEKDLALKEAEKEAEKELVLKDSQKNLALRDAESLLNITKTGLKWRLKSQTQRRVLERFLSDCWESMKKWDNTTVTAVKKRIKTFPNNPVDSREPSMTMLQDVIMLDIPVCSDLRHEVLKGVEYPKLSENVIYGVLSERIHRMGDSDDLFVGDDEGDDINKFYQVLANKYGYKITQLKRDEQVAYEELVKRGG